MNYTITCKNYKLTIEDNKALKLVQGKFSKLFATFQKDSPILKIVLRKHKKNSLDHPIKRFIKEHEITKISHHKYIDNPYFFDGTMLINLPKKPLVVQMIGKSVKEAFLAGFESMKEELLKYKGKHFKSHSEYFDKSSIRKIEERMNEGI